MLAYSMYDQTKGRKILAYQTIPYCEKIIEGIQLEEVEQYHGGLGKLFKWLQTALSGRKIDITRRKIATRRAKEDRQAKIEKEEDRKQRREDYLVDTKLAWEEENKEAIEKYTKYVDRKRRIEEGQPVSDQDDDDDGEDEEGKEKPPPEKPVFNEKEALDIFDAKEENAVV